MFPLISARREPFWELCGCQVRLAHEIADASGSVRPRNRFSLVLGQSEPRLVQAARIRVAIDWDGDGAIRPGHRKRCRQSQPVAVRRPTVPAIGGRSYTLPPTLQEHARSVSSPLATNPPASLLPSRTTPNRSLLCSSGFRLSRRNVRGERHATVGTRRTRPSAHFSCTKYSARVADIPTRRSFPWPSQYPGC
jgi:hypothetical protein